MPKYTDEQIRAAVSDSTSWLQVCRKVQTKNITTGSQAHFKKRADMAGIDYSHFPGRSWSKGREFPKRRIPIEDYLSIDGLFITSHNLKVKLIKAGIKPAHCEECGISEWKGEPLPLELDHINSIHSDNRIENLKILCPNCHGIKTRRDLQNRRVVNREQQTAEA